MPWNYRAWGTAVDPIHKSQLTAIQGDYGCPRKFRYEMDARADAVPGADERETVHGKAAAGTAAHETIARALGNPELRDHLLAGGTISSDSVRVPFREEYEREIGGRRAEWYADDEAEELADRVQMIRGTLNSLHKYVAEVLLIEPGFIAPLGPYWLSGHVDLVYRPLSDPRALAIADWKTGLSKPHHIELDHGWEAGVYSTAVKQGIFVRREAISLAPNDDGRITASLGEYSVTHASRYIAEREVLEGAMIEIALRWDASRRGNRYDFISPVDHAHTERFGTFPSEVWLVHAADFVPYVKSGKKNAKRPEDLRFYGVDAPQQVHYSAGDYRGPGWLPRQLTEHDMPRLLSRLKNVVGMIRMGRFIDQVGERCERCQWRSDCLTSGYAPTGEDKTALERALRASVDSADHAAALDGALDD